MATESIQQLLQEAISCKTTTVSASSSAGCAEAKLIP
uniref:Uncharacterized protein n=1 Tax=Ciona savignyi TaxID=51511 RepID=H2ZNG1_CIOSA